MLRTHFEHAVATVRDAMGGEILLAIMGVNLGSNSAGYIEYSITSSSLLSFIQLHFRRLLSTHQFTSDIGRIGRWSC